MKGERQQNRLTPKEIKNPFLEFVLGGGITLFSAGFCMWLCQYACGCSLKEITAKSAFVIFITIYAIVFSFVTALSGQILLGNRNAMAFLFVVTVVDYQVYAFRGTEILPGDVLSIRTALSVAGHYRPQLTTHLVVACLLVVIYLAGLGLVGRFRKGLFWRGIAVGVLAAAVLVFTQIIHFVPLLTFGNEGMRQSSFVVNFSRQAYASTAEEPEGYSAEQIRELETLYCQESDSPRRPVIIAIMNESFVDFNVVGDLPVEEDVLPFFHSLQENTVKGWAQTPIFGAGTANAEWEFLTGHSMRFLPTGTTPYRNSGLTDSYASIVSNLKKIGYHCIAMHPHVGYSYSRNSVYPNMGFDDVLFIDDFPREHLIRERVSDREMYEEIIRQYEGRQDDAPLFLFGVTIQNHGGYEYEGGEELKAVKLRNMSRDYPKAEQYLSVLKESDDALAYLIAYFQTVEEDVVIAFFGDHLPWVEEDFYEELSQGKTDEQHQLDRNTVPFFIWANYEIEAQTVEMTGVNYLTNYIYDVEGIPKPAYNQFLTELQNNVPVISVGQVYSASKGQYVDITQLSEKEEKLMQQYHYLIYNAVYDVDGRSRMFLKNEG